MPSPSPASDIYSYSYDSLDRLTQGVMGSGQGRETLTYDRMGNIESLQVVRQFNQHYKDASVSESNFDDLSNEYSFTGQLKSSTRKHHAGSGTIPAVTVTTVQTYDHMDRPLDTWTKVDNGTRIPGNPQGLQRNRAVS